MSSISFDIPDWIGHRATFLLEAYAPAGRDLQVNIKGLPEWSIRQWSELVRPSGVRWLLEHGMVLNDVVLTIDHECLVLPKMYVRAVEARVRDLGAIATSIELIDGSQQPLR